MKANVLIYDFFSVRCVRSETPVVVKLPWLSLKPRPNEIWMCREWIRVMEWAKYCLRGVSAILSWGDRYSGLRKVKTPLQVQRIHQQAGGSLSPCNVDDCCTTEYFLVYEEKMELVEIPVTFTCDEGLTLRTRSLQLFFITSTTLLCLCHSNTTGAWF